MIIKYIINAQKNTPKSLCITRLVRYIWRPENTHQREKCIFASARNFFTGKRSSRIMEMTVLALEATRSPDPIAHFVLSWPANEHPSPAQVREAVEIVMRELGLQVYQVIYGLHADTDNDHVHLAINLVHPVDAKKIRLSLQMVCQSGCQCTLCG